jgi:hypothetical protein
MYVLVTAALDLDLTYKVATTPLLTVYQFIDRLMPGRLIVVVLHVIPQFWPLDLLLHMSTVFNSEESEIQ